MLYEQKLRDLMSDPQYASTGYRGAGGGVGGFNLFTAIKNLFTPKPAAAAPKQVQTPAPKPFVPQISTQQGTKTYSSGPTYSSNFQTKAPTPQYSTPSNSVGMSTNQGPVYNTGSGSYSVSSGQPIDLQRISYSAPSVTKAPSITYNRPSQDIANIGSGLGSLASGSISTLMGGNQPTRQTIGSNYKQILGGLVGGLGTLGTKALSVIPGGQWISSYQKATGRNPLEFGLSELGNIGSVQAAERTPNILKETSNVAASKTPTTINRGVTPNPVTGEDLTAKQDQLVKDVATNDKELDDFYALINDPTVKGELDAIDEKIYNEAVNNGLSQEEYNKKVFDEQKKVLIDQYNKLKAEAEGEIPYLQTQTDQEIADEVANLEKTKKAAESKKAETNMTYDELLKKSVSTQRDEENRLRNIFSNLGTAESSAFINKLGGLVGERGAERSKIDLTRVKDLTSIADFITEQETTSSKNTKKYKDLLAENIRKIQSYITNDLGSQTAQGISGLTQNLYSKLAEGKQNLFNTKATLLQNQATRATNLQDKLGSYALESGLIKEQADATRGLTGANAGVIQGYTRPSGFEQSMWTKAEQLAKSGVNKESILNQLKSIYGGNTAYSWMLDYLGKILA